MERKLGRRLFQVPASWTVSSHSTARLRKVMDYASYPNPAFRRASESCFRMRSPSSTVVAAAWVSPVSLCLAVRFSCAVAEAWALLWFSPSRSRP